jgi:hypothetical protein
MYTEYCLYCIQRCPKKCFLFLFFYTIIQHILKIYDKILLSYPLNIHVKLNRTHIKKQTNKKQCITQNYAVFPAHSHSYAVNAINAMYYQRSV